MKDVTHLVALHEGLGREKRRLAVAKTEGERALRTVWIAQSEREIESELAFLGMSSGSGAPTSKMSDEDLLAELSGL